MGNTKQQFEAETSCVFSPLFEPVTAEIKQFTFNVGNPTT